MKFSSRLCVRLAIGIGALACQVAAFASPPTYKVVELPFSPFSINNKGQIVGIDAHHLPVLWENGSITKLDTNRWQPTAISGNGYVAGMIQSSDPFSGIVEHKGQKTALAAILYGVNNSGVASGVAGGVQAVTCANGVVSPLADMGHGSSAGAINNAGTVTGSVVNPTGGGSLAIWKKGTLVVLGSFGKKNLEGYGINDAGVVVGSGDNGVYQGRLNSFIYQNGQIKFFDPLPQTSRALLWAINNRQEAVGWCDNNGEPYVWADDAHKFAAVPQSIAMYNKDGVQYDLNQLLEPGSKTWVFEAAVSINDQGWIVGSGVDASGKRHGLLAMPVKDKK